MNGKRFVKSVGFSCMVLVWLVNVAVAPGPGPEAVQWFPLPQWSPPPQGALLPQASAFPDSGGQMEVQDTSSPFTLT